MKKYLKHLTIISGILTTISCNDFLDREPLDKITPEVYFNNESDLAAYSVKLYPEANFLTISPGQYGRFGSHHLSCSQIVVFPAQ